MILTGAAIHEEVLVGNINLKPFDVRQINPNSYNYRISDTLKILKSADGNHPVFEEIEIPQIGIILEPHQLYLACTKEVIGSRKYAMSLIGRSSLGRLGLFLQVSANLGHTTAEHQWTLELVAAHKIMIYPRMVIGQVSFWENQGEVESYHGRYGRVSNIQEYLHD